jgi:type II secretory pathway pseudopilin PulG
MEVAQAFIFLRKILVLTVIAILPISYGMMKLNLDQQKRKQHRSMSNIYAIARAVEEYGVEHQAYPTGNSNVLALSIHLKKYRKEIPMKDAWGNDFLYESSNDLQSYTITSYGNDHKPDMPSHYKGVITRFSNDITFSRGTFTAFPEGI